MCRYYYMCRYQGRIQDFKLGGGALKKIAPSGGRREHFWGIPSEKSRFYATKSYFSNFRGGAREIFGVFHVKNHDFMPKKSFFCPILGGAHAPESAPASPIGLFFAKKSQILQILQLAIYQLICNMHG